MNEQIYLPGIDISPRGFNYLPDFISKDEERNLMLEIGDLTLHPYELFGVEAKRNIISFVHPFPDWLMELDQRVEEILQEKIVEILVTQYPPGAGIGWHMDYPEYKSVFGISLGHSCLWQMRKREEFDILKYKRVLYPRSVYILKDEARWKWEHKIKNAEEERFSITFRSRA